MIKLTKLSFDLKDETQQKINDITEIYQEEVIKADNAGMPPPTPPKPIKLKNVDYNIRESNYYVQAKLVEEIWDDEENVTVISVAGKEVYVKETVEEVHKLKLRKDGSSK